MKRFVLVGLGTLGVVSLIVGVVWWISTAPQGATGPFFLLPSGIFLVFFAASSLRCTHEIAAALLAAVALQFVHHGRCPLSSTPYHQPRGIHALRGLPEALATGLQAVTGAEVRVL